MTPFILICGIICFLCALLIYVQLRLVQCDLDLANARNAELEALLEETREAKFRDAKEAELDMARIKNHVKNIQRIIDHAEPNDAKPSDSVWKSCVTRFRIKP